IRGRYAVDRLIDDVILKEHRVPAGSLGSHHELDQRPRVRIGAPGCEVEAVSHQRSTLWPWSDGPPPPAPPGTPPARRGRDAPSPGSAGHSPDCAVDWTGESMQWS